MTTDRILKLLAWPAAIWIAYEFLWYEQYKLTGNVGSIDGVFQPLANWFGIPAHEKPIRLGVAILEIIASVLVLIPRTRVLGAFLALGTMSGAIFFHLTRLGVALTPVGDNGELFALAVLVTLFAAAILLMHRQELPALVRRFA